MSTNSFKNSIAKIVSIVFHPVFVPAYAYAMLLFFSPNIFIGVAEKNKTWWFITLTYTSVMLPLLTVFLLWRLKFIDSMHMRGNKERLGPLIASMMFYFWVYWLFHKQFNAPILLQIFLLGVFLTTVLSFLGTIFLKISLHASAWSGFTTFLLCCMFYNTQNSFLLFSVTLLLTGGIASMRLLLLEHTPREVYIGLCIGILAQTIACFIAPLVK